MFSKSQKNYLKLDYKDNGQWKKPKDENSFGLELIETFTEQLDGKLTINTENITTFSFVFEAIKLT